MLLCPHLHVQMTQRLLELQRPNFNVKSISRGLTVRRPQRRQKGPQAQLFVHVKWQGQHERRNPVQQSRTCVQGMSKEEKWVQLGLTSTSC